MAKTGRPRKYKTGKELMDAINGFIQYSHDNNIRPTDYQVCVYLGMSPDSLELYANRTNPKPSNKANSKDKDNIQDSEDIEITYSAAIKKLAMYRQDWYLSHAEANPKLTAIDIFALKQPCNGGWADKQQTDNGGSMSIDIKLSGASGEAFESEPKTDN